MLSAIVGLRGKVSTATRRGTFQQPFLTHSLSARTKLAQVSATWPLNLAIADCLAALQALSLQPSKVAAAVLPRSSSGHLLSRGACTLAVAVTLYARAAPGAKAAEETNTKASNRKIRIVKLLLVAICQKSWVPRFN